MTELLLPRQPRQHRNRRWRAVGQQVVSVSAIERAVSEEEDEVAKADSVFREQLESLRPRTRADCEQIPRPCPFISCRHHLYADMLPGGSLKINFPDISPSELEHSCVLDLVEEEREFTLEEIAVLMNLTREMVRQVETNALNKVKAAYTRASRQPESDWAKGVIDVANLQIVRNATGSKAIVVHSPEKSLARIEFTCSACMGCSTVSFSGYSTRDIELLAGMGCMRRSECCKAAVSAKIVGLQGKRVTGRHAREQHLAGEILLRLTEVGAAGLSLRQLLRSVTGDNNTIAKVVRNLAIKGLVQRKRIGAYDRFIKTPVKTPVLENSQHT